MKPLKNVLLLAGAGGLLLIAPGRAVALVNFTSQAGYNAAVGVHQVITFTGLSNGTLLGAQYSGLGVVFPEGNDAIFPSPSFVTDGVGVNGSGTIELQFTGPMNHVGADYPGALKIQLYSGNVLVGTSQNFGEAGTGFFGGVLDQGITFDRAILSDWFDDQVYIDNLHFGLTAVPEPSTGALLLISFGAHAIRRLRAK